MSIEIDEIVIGDSVVCDYCDEEYTESAEVGGLIFAGSAVCPKCEPKCRERARRHHNEQAIEAECPPGMTFKEFVLRVRRSDRIVMVWW